MSNFSNSSGLKITLKILLFVGAYVFGVYTSNWWSNKIMDTRKNIAIKLYPVEQNDSTIRVDTVDYDSAIEKIDTITF